MINIFVSDIFIEVLSFSKKSSNLASLLIGVSNEHDRVTAGRKKREKEKIEK